MIGGTSMLTGTRRCPRPSESGLGARLRALAGCVALTALLLPASCGSPGHGGPSSSPDYFYDQLSSAESSQDAIDPSSLAEALPNSTTFFPSARSQNSPGRGKFSDL